LFEGLEIGEPVGNAPSDLYLCGVFAGPPPAFQDVVQYGRAVCKSFPVQTGWFIIVYFSASHTPAPENRREAAPDKAHSRRRAR
jgi:hypothetical protein